MLGRSNDQPHDKVYRTIALTHGNPSSIRSGFATVDVAKSGATALLGLFDITKTLLLFMSRLSLALVLRHGY